MISGLKFWRLIGKNLSQSKHSADRFNVSYSFVWKLLERYGKTRKVDPLPHGGGAKPKLNQNQLAVVVQLVEQDNDATLEELVTQLQETILCQSQPDHHGAGGTTAQAYPKKKLCTLLVRDTVRVQQLRVEYWQVIREVNEDDKRVC